MWVHQEKTRLNIAVNSNKDLFQAWQNVQIPYPFLASGILPAGLIQPEDFRAKHLTGTGHPLISFNFNILKNQEGLTRGCNLQLGHRTFAQQRGKKQPRKLRSLCDYCQLPVSSAWLHTKLQNILCQGQLGNTLHTMQSNVLCIWTWIKVWIKRPNV